VRPPESDRTIGTTTGTGTTQSPETRRVSPARKAWFALEYLGARATILLVSLVPVWVALLIAEAASRVCFLSMRRRRAIAIENIRNAGVAADPREVKRLALCSFRTVIVTIVEAILVRRRMNAQNWRDFVRLDIPPDLERILKDRNQGVIVASGHMGNWEVVARAAAMLRPLCAIYRPFNNPYLDRSVHADRGSSNLRLISKYDSDPRRLLRILQTGEALAVMIDQHARNGVPVRFFGRKALTTPSVAMLHLVTRTPILVAYAIRVGPLRYEVRATGPFQFERSGDRNRDVLQITQRLTDEIESSVRRHPDQYMWGHRRWR
jgi:KDO2-lipid IV(A) lauroyltransferase